MKPTRIKGGANLERFIKPQREFLQQVRKTMEDNHTLVGQCEEPFPKSRRKKKTVSG